MAISQQVIVAVRQANFKASQDNSRRLDIAGYLKELSDACTWICSKKVLLRLPIGSEFERGSEVLWTKEIKCDDHNNDYDNNFQARL